MTKDLNKGISSISYNLLNLPQQVDILSPLAEATNRYSYSADGVKLRVGKTYNSGIGEAPIEIAAMFPDVGESNPASYSTVTSTTDYVGNKLFENGTLERILVDGGYIKDGTYYFYETDHLGSNRLTVSQTGAASDRSDYYPYGMQMAHNDPNKGNGLAQIDGYAKTSFKFSGKELDVMHGLNLYDSQARSYDPTLGIFTTADPLAEDTPRLSPYVYCSDNPINRVDPDGRQDVITTYEAYEAYATSTATATTGSNMGAGQAMVELGGIVVGFVKGQLDQMKEKVVNSYKTLTGQSTHGYTVEIQKKGAKDLVGEAKESQAKREKAQERKENKEAQTARGNNRSGNSNGEVKGNHKNLKNGKSNKNDHEEANARRAREQKKAEEKKKK